MIFWGLVWLACGVASALVASSKGRSGTGFFILGVLLGPLGLLGAGVAGKASAEPSPREIKAGLQSGDLRKCPHCDQPISAAAKVCRYCQRDVPPPPQLNWLGREIR